MKKFVEELYQPMAVQFTPILQPVVDVMSNVKTKNPADKEVLSFNATVFRNFIAGIQLSFDNFERAFYEKLEHMGPNVRGLVEDEMYGAYKIALAGAAENVINMIGQIEESWVKYPDVILNCEQAKKKLGDLTSATKIVHNYRN